MYIFIHLFFYSYQVFTLAILVGYSALCQCACSLPVGSCVGPEAGASGPETWGPRCLWGHCCGSSLESHVHAVAGSPCIPSRPPCRGFSLACLQDHCWSPAPRPCSRATRATAGPTQCPWKLGQGPQGEGPWVAVGTPRRSWAYGAPVTRQGRGTIFKDATQTPIYTLIFMILVKPSDLIIWTLIGVGVNVLGFWWERAKRDDRQKYWRRVTGREEGENQSQSVHYLTSLYAQKISSSGRQLCSSIGFTKKWILTSAGAGIVAVAGAGVLGVAGVEAAEGWGLELGTGCVEGVGFTVVWTGVRGVTFGAGAGGSARSTLFSWRVILSEQQFQTFRF